MGLMDFIKGELIEIIEWTDDSRDTLSFRWPDDDKNIKNGAQLIVRESQTVQFVYVGQFGDTFGPGKYTLTTDNIPILTKLQGWKYGFGSPFKADVYFVNTRLFTGNKFSRDAEGKRHVLPRDVAAAQADGDRPFETGERAQDCFFQQIRRGVARDAIQHLAEDDSWDAFKLARVAHLPQHAVHLVGLGAGVFKK